jgi:hypothetical protein
MTDKGDLIRLVGEFTPEEGDDLELSSRALTVSRDRTHFWVMRGNQYDLQRFTLDGENDLKIRVENSPWMREWLRPPTSTYTRLSHVDDAGGGRLWIGGFVPAIGVTSMSSAGTGTWPAHAETMQSTVIELLDVERGTILASRKFEREVYHFVDGDHVVRQRQDAAGLVSWDIYRIHLRER